ncbi:ATP-dependent DNA ligase [Candidatus Woesearchaeota archaeon]|nr:ATP-dependent DNA ligase [Candidatus Woesearchaeota archaeon]
MPLIYSIQKHSATHLHYDLRLEKDRVLKSWAIPKEPPKKKGEKRLAVQVDDHDLDYAFWKGTIPEGSYGAGKVEVWDKGSYEVVEQEKDKWLIKINGKKLKGEYALIRTKLNNNPKNWLFFKV